MSKDNSVVLYFVLVRFQPNDLLTLLQSVRRTLIQAMWLICKYAVQNY